MNINKELNLSKKIIYDITKFTTVDYPEHLSCVIWFISCNMRCSYCYNPDIVLSNKSSYSIKNLFEFLEKRVGLLDAVVLSGGEATIHWELMRICKKIKEMGFKIKLDTNGSNTKLINELVDYKLIDFISLDFKSTKKKYYEITKSNNYECFINTLKYLISKNFDFEVRTTIHRDLLDESDINDMQKILKNSGYKNSFYIQSFLENKNLGNLKISKKSFDTTKVEKILNIIYRY